MDNEELYLSSDLSDEDDGFDLKSTVNRNMNKVIKVFSGSDYKIHKKMIDNLIAVTGLSGGVGTSTIVANLAYMAEKEGLSVIVVDTNIVYPTQHIYFGIKQQIKKTDLVSFLGGGAKLGECIDYKGEVGVVYANNRTLTDLVNCDNADAANNFGKMINSLSDLFDLVIVDCSNRVENDIVNMALYKADVIYTIMDENIENLSNLERFKNSLQLTGIPTSKIRTIMNKRTSIFYNESILKSFKISLVDILPFDTAIIESGLRGEIFCKSGSSSRKTASQFVGRMEVLTTKILENGGYSRG